MVRLIAQPRYPWLYFGDGQAAQLIQIKEGVLAEDGRQMTELKFRPTKSLVYKYNISDEQFDRFDLTITKNYPSAQVIALDRDPTAGAFLVMCDYNGSDTVLTRQYVEQLQAIQGYEKVIHSLKGELVWLHEQMRKQGSQIQEYDKETVKRLKRIFALRAKKEEEEEGEEEDRAFKG